MVLSNSAKRARYASTTSVQNQGGGSKKAGFPYIVGRSSWTSIYMGPIKCTKTETRCCTLQNMQMTSTKAAPSRNIGRMGVAYNSVTGAQK
jgi:hypothetical protein